MSLSPTVVKSRGVGDPAYILATVNELVYGYHAIFIFIHLLLEREDRKDEQNKHTEAGRGPINTEKKNKQRHLPGRILLHADEASPLSGRDMCIFPSCRR